MALLVEAPEVTRLVDGVLLVIPEVTRLICAPDELTAWSLLAVWLVERRARALLDPVVHDQPVVANGPDVPGPSPPDAVDVARL